MNLSIGEFRALVAKACRGSGYAWGLTEEAAHATGWLAQRGVDSASMLVRLLGHVDGRAITDLMGPFGAAPAEPGCPICVGAAMVDRRAVPTSPLLVVEPLLLASALARLLETEDRAAFEASWTSGRVLVTATGLLLEGDVPAEPVSVSVSAVDVRVNTPTVGHRIDVDSETIAALERYVQRTYAPATDASRASGAGAGLLDND